MKLPRSAHFGTAGGIASIFGPSGVVPTAGDAHRPNPGRTAESSDEIRARQALYSECWTLATTLPSPTRTFRRERSPPQPLTPTGATRFRLRPHSRPWIRQNPRCPPPTKRPYAAFCRRLLPTFRSAIPVRPTRQCRSLGPRRGVLGLIASAGPILGSSPSFSASSDGGKSRGRRRGARSFSAGAGIAAGFLSIVFFVGEVAPPVALHPSKLPRRPPAKNLPAAVSPTTKTSDPRRRPAHLAEPRPTPARSRPSASRSSTSRSACVARERAAAPTRRSHGARRALCSRQRLWVTCALPGLAPRFPIRDADGARHIRLVRVDRGLRRRLASLRSLRDHGRASFSSIRICA